MNAIQAKLSRRATALLLTSVIGIAIVGFFVGINDEIFNGDENETVSATIASSKHEASLNSSSISVMPAADYSEMRQSDAASSQSPNPILTRFHSEKEFTHCISCHNPHNASVGPNEAEKLHSLARRAERRAFNGAPPVIPHAVDQTNDAACYACHGEGALVGNRIANRMSHGWLANCLQCHAAGPPLALAHMENPVSNGFVGLPAPTSGPRAFDGAPPLVPHSTWMREQCLSCHGPMGWAGLEVTHRWRANCLQCHATSAVLEQSIAGSDTNAHATLATW